MKWANCYLICMHPQNPTILNSSLQYIQRYNLPQNQCFSLIPAVRSPNSFTTLSNNSLSNVRLIDKLIIVAHGSENSVHNFDPKSMAELLARNGLTTAGLIAFKACNVGKGDYLRQFHNECVMVRMEIGWYIAYKQTAATSNGRELVTKLDYFLDFLGLRYLFGLKNTDDKRVRVYEGNADFQNLASHRYS